MSRKNIENIYSLSPMQQGILFHALYAQEPGVYFVQLSWTLKGRLDTTAFKRAWQDVVDRHPVLRTSFAWERLEKPMQIVRKRVDLPFEERDLSSLPGDEQARAIDRFEAEDRARGFDLTKAPILRVAVLRLGEDLHRFVWGTHHLVLDGWSLPSILKEVFALYEAHVQGREVRLDRVRPYGEYIAWLKKQDMGRAEAFWRKQLEGFSAPTPFRVDRASPEGAEWTTGEQQLVFAEDDSARLLAFTRQHRITPGTLVQGAWALLLARYSGEPDVLFGATVSGRAAPVPGIEQMVGMFINTLPIRVKAPPDQPVSAWLLALQEQQADIREYEYSPLVDIQGWSEVPRGTPLFESQMAFENTPEQERGAQGGLEIVASHMYSQTHFPMTIVASFRRRLFMRFRYDERRFDAATIERMIGHLRSLFEAMAKDPACPIGDLPLLTEAERDREIALWNDTAADFSSDALAHELFEQTAKRTPDATALVAGAERVSFRELDQRSNRLARHLRKLGVGPDTVVGLCMDRGADLVTGMLGILKAGGAYVPLDPAYPPSRLLQILDDAKAPVLVTQAALAALPAGGPAVVRLDSDAALIAAESDDRVDSGATSRNLAYVLFTSGSTGKPKGVAIEHRQLVNYVRGVSARLGLPADASYAHISTFAADLGNTVLFPPLMLGGTLHLILQDLTTDPNGLAAYFAREGIDCLKIVPSHFSAMLSAAHPEQVVPRKLLVLGGEASSWELIERIEKLAPDTRIMNHYGPTETTVGVLTYPVERGKREEGTAIVPLGRPLPFSRVYVLDQRMLPVPPGVPGEVFIGGAGVARGYLGRPDLTAERFVADPFGKDPSDRLYRTGDRARYLPNGAIVFLGRIDFQVKIRGYRIELGEIESALLSNADIKEAVLLAQDGEGAGDKRLVAYLVPASRPGPTIAELTAFLGERLPEYMVPAAFVVLDALPLTPNGKIDRRALPALEDQAQAPADAYVAPRGPTEEVLAGIWSDVFSREKVSVHDRFADLGGHSLLAIQIIARTREAFQTQIPLRAIFESPTIAGLAEVVDAAMREDLGLDAPPIAVVPRDREIRASFAQERLWFLDQLEPGSPFYNVPTALRLSGAIDLAALERAIREVVRRHEVLRTTFASVSGRTVQVIHPDVDLAFPNVDLRSVPAAEREAAMRREAEIEAKRPFDLSKGPLVRASIVTLGDDDHVLLFTNHHIVSDGWTRGVLNREIGALYTAFTAGRPSPLPDLAIQYADYAEWQRGWLQGEVLDRQIAYWKQQMAGAPHAIEFPTDKPRPPVQRYRGGRQWVQLSPEATRALKDLARREGVTLYMTLLGALDVLLHRYTGQDDVVIGTSVTNRTRAETEGLIGFFINALALRTQVTDDISFVDLLQRVREVCLGAYAHQDMPFERLVQELQPEPDPSRAPLFQVIFTMMNPPAEAMKLPGLSLKWMATDSETVKYDLTFLMGDSPRGLAVVIDFNTDLFEPGTIERMLGHFATLLEAVGKDAQRKVGDLPLLAAEERSRLLHGWNATAAEYPAEECAHDLFEATCDRTPDAPALVAGQARLTFRALDSRANRLAHHLASLGVGPDSVVGLCMDRTADLVIGMLGILKAGGAYVPLDPSYPKHRLADILGEAGSRVVVTQGAFASALPEGVAAVRVDSDAATIAAHGDARPDTQVLSANLAYVLFTSGSTGKPKGVAIEHRQLVNYVRGVASRLALPEGSSYAHVSTFAADLGNTVLFPPLMLGGALHLIAQELTTDPNGLAAYFEREGIDCLKIVPSHLSALLSAAHPEQVIPRKLLVLGGEASSWELIERIEKLSPDTRIMNHYGPTETTVGVLTYPVERGKREPNTAIVPLGKPLPNSRIHVLDRQMSPTPAGVPGEVYIGGAGVARGYLGRPDLTAERFVADPFSGARDARLYRTGDRAKYLPNGNLLFLGRIDFQVKIRGYRIELGEIESALSSHPALKEVVVLAQEEASGDKRLVAYVVPREQPGPDGFDLRTFLEERLPEYMIPAAFVRLEAIPLTPNGKIDRRALPAYEQRTEETGEDQTAPRNPVEEVLASIWCDVFEKEKIGVHERFSELGGHSLLAIQIIARAREAFQVELPLRSIFETPTIAGLAERVAAAVREGEGLDVPGIVRVPRDADLPLSFGQERLWFLAALEPDNPFYNIPSGLRLTGRLDTDAFARAVREVVWRHEVLRTTFSTVDGRPFLVVHDEIDLPIAVEDLSALPAAEREEAVRREADLEAKKPFDLAKGPLVRVRLLFVAEGDHVALITLHHIVSDAWTRGLFNRELAILYTAFVRGMPSPLRELPVQYADYAAWQRKWLDGEVLDRHVAYWKKQLAGAPQAIDLPTDRPRPPVQTFHGERSRFSLSADVTKALKDLSRREGATLFMTLLAAFDLLLRRYTGQTDVVVGTPIANRSLAETEELIGFFLNTLVLRTEVSDGQTFVELLQHVREVCLGGYAHQDMPFERLVQELAPARDLSRTPLFQVLFTLQNTGAEALALSGLTLRPMGGQSATAKFDLTLGMGETPAGLLGSFEYNTDLFDAATIDRMIVHFTTLLSSIAAAPEARVHELAMIGAAERQRLLVELNDTRCNYPVDACIHELFEAQADRTPDAVAVSFEGLSLTYRDLDRRGNQLAHALRRRGVGPDVLVGVCMERSLDLLVALYGILKAGGAYVPLDPEYPRDRLAFMLDDTKVPVLLTQSHLAGALPEHGAQVIRLDTEWALVASEPEDRPGRCGLTLDHLAYVIYTSGSTGRPKGAMNAHRGILNRLQWMQAEYGLDGSDRVLQKTPFSFDVSVWELFWPLMYGARMIVAKPGGHREPSYLVDLIASQGVTTLHFVPSMLAVFLEEQGLERCQPIRRVFCSGEALPAPMVETFFARIPAELHNLYGPTEAAVDVTSWACVRGSPVVPIGKPIHNTTIYLLDEHMQPVPMGIRGELYIGGVQVARGYLNRDELTKERFLPDPFVEGGRLYRTGDVARYLPGGDIEYLGRVDHQVKIRGFRIELGEIEADLAAHPSVRECVVVVREDAPGDKRIIAYLVFGDAPAPTVGELRAFLKEKLPEYMVPAAFVLLDRLPLTSSGKVDRRALPAPEEGDRPELGGAFIAPRTAVEEELARIWAQVLRLPKVGVHDNFFEIGGDSILSIQIVARAQQAGLAITPRQLFQHQTVAELSTVAGSRAGVEAEQGLVTGPVPFTPVQRWWLDLAPERPDHWNQSSFLEVKERLDAAALEHVIGHLLQHHDALRLRVAKGEAGFQQAIAGPPRAIPFRRVDLAAVPDAEISATIERITAETQESLDIAEGPVLRAVLFDLGEERQNRLFLAIHHLAVDGVSWRVLLDDLWSAYDQRRRGAAITLPPKTTSFKQWAERLASHASSEAVIAERDYWLSDVRRKAPRIPVDHALGDNLEETARSVVVSLSPEETEQLLRDVPEAYQTQINDVLLTAFAQAMGKWTGASVTLVDLEGHGREEMFADVDVTRTVGWFTAVYPLAIDLPQGAALGIALKSVKEQIRAVPGRGVGHGILRYLREGDPVAADLRAMPESEVSFNYLGQLDQALPEASPFRRARESSGPAHSPRARRRYLVDVLANVIGGRLNLRLTYSESRHRKDTIESLAADLVASLRALVAHCVSPEAGGYTPSDFPQAKISQAVVDKLAAPPGKANKNIEDVYPLTPMQQGILFHTLYASEPGVYFTQLGWTFSGDLDVASFVRAFQDVVDRHSILRTAFIWESLDAPLQVVYRRAPLPVEERDLRGLSPEQQADTVARFAIEDRRRGFDVAQAPLTRIALLRLADDTYRFFWSRHHLLLDGWSAPILIREVFGLYWAYAQGKEVRAERGRPYGDYIGWLLGQDTGRTEAFWRAQLAGITAPTPLGVDKAVPAAGGEVEFAERRLALSEAASARLAAFARQHQLTVNTLVQGAWALLLSRYSGEDDVVFGATVSGRSAPVPGIDRMVGLFINTLAVRVKVPAEQKVLAWLSAFQDQQAELRDFEHTPLVDAQRWSRVPRGTPLFESLVVFENYPLEQSVRDGQSSLAVRDVETVERPPYPLTILAAFRRSLVLRVGYEKRRFDDDAIERLTGHLENLLEGFARDPEKSLGELSPLGAEERRKLLAGWNDTRFDHPADACIHELFERQAAKTPDAIALSFEGRDLSYGELNARANRLARALRRRGVGPDVLVGVCMERSIEMVVSLYGILKAGGAYVPLDPEYPKERLSFMLDDTKVPVVLTQSHLGGALPEHGAEAIRLDTEWAAIAGESAENLGRDGLGIDHLAYVIYTSGSTGRPKGAMNAHRGILNRLQWMQSAYGLDGTDRVLQKTPFSFDVSVWEFFWPLMYGARLVVARPEGHKDSAYLVDLIASAGITTLHFVPSMLKVFLDEAGLDRCSSIRRVFASGEALTPPLVDAFHALIGKELHNLYGPTEAAVDVTSWATVKGSPIVPIGKPVHNTRIYLLDERMEPVPTGVRGELYIGGVQVARGYLNRDVLTAERFLADPFVAGGRLYRTGDVARYLPGGDIEYLGRIDHQVKIRGFRIELGEIEIALEQHPMVRDAAVVAREDVPGQKRIVAYLVLDLVAAEPPTVADLRAFLRERLPEYMVPAAFVVLPDLPLTSSGKVDRKALPAPEDGDRPDLGAAFVAPREGIEEELARIWAAVLRVEKVGVDDNFFALGGDSILSIQIVARAHQAGLSLTPRQLFQHQTIAELAEVVGTQKAAAPAEQGPVTGDVPLTPVQLWWIDKGLVDPDHWNQVSFLEAREKLDPAILEEVIAHLLVHHDALRLRVAKGESGWRQTLSAPGGSTPFRRIDLSGVPEDARKSALEKAAADAHASLDIAEGPMVRAVLFDMGDAPDRLLLVIHHLAVDGVSWRILLEDLWTAYEQRRRGDAIALPPKTTSWKRWAERLREHARTAEISAQEPHWTSDERARAGRLPIDHAGGANIEGSVRHVGVSLSPEETEALLREVPKAYRTQINDVLLAAFADAMSRWTGAEAVLVDLEGHGREELFEDLDLTRTVGWFTAVFPVLLSTADVMGPGDLLKSVKEQLRAVPDRGVGHGLLRYLRSGEPVEARLRALPQAEVSFNYLGQVDQAISGAAPFRAAREASGRARSLRNARQYLLDVNANVAGGRLNAQWSYSEARHDRATIEALAQSFIAKLREIIAHCTSPGATGVTPSDFQDTGLSQGALDMLIDLMDEDQ